MTIDLTPLVALLSQINPLYGAIAAAAIYFLGPKLVPLLQKLLGKLPGGVPVLPNLPPVVPGPDLPAEPKVPDAPKTPDNRPVLDALGKLLLELLAKRAKQEGKTVEAVVTEYVADEVK